jgi:2-polyprenyl-3-methyl-5-hydroxy-6-metoxy-1,4-benzoquinol methylase
MTTAGRLVQESLAKAQCSSCGILQRVEIRQLGETNFYETQYSFYERPGAAQFDAPRYAAMADWLAESIAPFVPKTVFDAGCGRGWMLEALSRRFPEAAFQGIEPSEQESANARARGLAVVTGKVGPNSNIQGQFDLVYSTNVLEHTTDPVQFLTTLRNMVKETGFVLILCPDASVPNAEFMFSDQNYSFSPDQLALLGRRAGLALVSQSTRPEVPSLVDKQVMVFAIDRGAQEGRKPVDRGSLAELLRTRIEYVASYQRCDEYLAAQTEGSGRVINFGTSTWSMLLAAYCPRYWERVQSCVIDGGYGEFITKPVYDARHFEFRSDDVVVLGTNPFTQEAFDQRLGERGIRSIRWNSIVAR